MIFRLKFVVIASVAFIGIRAAAAGDTAWFFTAAEIDAAYRYQENFGSRLHHPLKPHACYHGQKEFIASFQGKTFLAPCRFIIETTRHLKQTLEQGAARYLFPLDADHAHLAVPIEIWREKYRNPSVDQVLPELLREPELVALYHTAEHLAINEKSNGREYALTREWRAKRNVLGFFDGTPIKILPPLPNGDGYDRPDKYQTVGTVYFLAHRLGEIVLSARGKGLSIDLSFDEDSAEVP